MEDVTQEVVDGDNVKTEDIVSEEKESEECKSEDTDWMDIIGSGGLKKKILTEGICESRPSKGNSVKIKAVGRLVDGTEVETLEEFVFTVGDGEVISGLDLVVVLMDKGEESDVFMEARFAYGEKGLEPNIPPNSDLFYKVHLIDFKPEEDPEQIPIAERLSVGIRKRERGNWWFKREDNRQAISCYKSAIDYLDDTSDTLGENLTSEMREILEERLKTLNNMAAAQIKVEAYDMALKSLDTILRCQPDNLKALFRKGKVLGYQGEVKEGLEFLKKALTVDPDSKVIQIEVIKLQEKLKEIEASERGLYRRMLGLKAPQKKKQEEQDRYPTLRGLCPDSADISGAMGRTKQSHLKLWASLFVVIFSVLMAYRYQDHWIEYLVKK